MSQGVSFHLWLRAARRATLSPATGKPMKQRELAELCGLGESGYISISRYERGQRIPHPIIRAQLFRFLPTQEQLDIKP